MAIFFFTLLSVLCLLTSTPSVHALTSFSTSDTNLVKNGLVGYWTFDGKNMTNAIATDVSGQGNNGTLINGPVRVKGKIGQGLSFGGVDDYVDIGTNSSAFNFSGDVSGSAWIKTNVDGKIFLFYQNVNPLIYMQVGGTTAGGTANKFVVYLRTNGGSVIVVSGNITVTDNKWHHVAFSRSITAQEVRLYVDGNLDVTSSYTDVGAIDTTGTQHTVGFPGALYKFSGSLDDVRVYNRAISQSEVQSLYKAGGGVLTAASQSVSNPIAINSGLVGYWTFDGKNMTNATATDVSGNGNDGTLINTTASIAKAAGKIGGGLQFIGWNGASPRYISVPNSSSLNLSGKNTFTLSTWVKFNSFYTGTCRNNTLIQKGNDTDAGFYVLRIYDTGGCGAVTGVYAAGLWFRDSGGSSYIVDATTTENFKINTWYHLVATCNGISCIMYRNGVNIGATSISAAVGSNTGLLSIGEASQNGFGFQYSVDGIQDDVRIYNRGLSAVEVQSLYKLGQVSTAVSSAPASTGGTGINSGLVGYWTFDGKNMTNATATDVSGNGNNGTLVNVPVKVIGKIGQGINFDGTNSYVNAGGASSVAITGNITVSTWFNVDSFNANNIPSSCSNYGPLVVKGYDGTNTGYQIDFQNDAATGNVPQLLWASWNGASHGTGYTYGASIVPSKWYFMLGTYDGATWRLYLNGVLVSSSADATGPQSTSKSLLLGAFDLNGTICKFGGKQDDVRVYNRAISSSEVRSLYKLGTQ